MNEALEISATLLGLIQGVLVMLDKRSNWVFYSLQMLFLVAFSFKVRLWGDVLIDSVYFLMGVAGFILWKKGSSVDSITTYSRKVRALWTFAAIIATVTAYSVLRGTDNPLPLLDSITSVTSIIATWFMFRHKLEAWIVWFFNDLFYIAEYFMLPDKAIYLICLYVVWTILAVASYVNWRRLIHSNNDSFPSPK